MKFKLLAMTALFGVMAAACGNSGDSSGTGGGGTGGGGTGGDNTNVTTGTMGNTTTGGPTGTCDDIGVCQTMDGTDPTAGCVECAVLGDDTVATDGGACADAYIACFGTMGDCSDGNPNCCAFIDCINACPADDPNTPADEELDCICANDGMSCVADQTGSMSCAGTTGDGIQDYAGFAICIVQDVCPVSCGG